MGSTSKRLRTRRVEEPTISLEAVKAVEWEVTGLVGRRVNERCQSERGVWKLFRGCGPMRTDFAALGPELTQKVIERERRLGAAAYYERRNTAGSTALVGVSRAAVLLSGLFVTSLMLSLTGGPGPLWMPALLGLVALAPSATCAVRLARRSRAAHDPLTLSTAEFAAVRQARVRIKPDKLLDNLYYADNLYDTGDYDTWDGPSAIIVTALRILNQIQASPAWGSQHLDADRIQLDLKEELYQVVESCNQLRKLSEAVDRTAPDQRDDSTLVGKLSDQANEYRALRDEARTAIIARVAALREYRSRLTKVEGLIANIKRATQAVAGNDDFTEAFTAITRDRAATARAIELSAGLEDLRERLSLELDFIRSQVVASAELGAPLVLRAPMVIGHSQDHSAGSGQIVVRHRGGTETPPAPDHQPHAASATGPQPACRGTINEARQALADLLDEWAHYRLDSEAWYLTKPLLHDVTGTVATTVAYDRAMQALSDAVEALHPGSAQSDIDDANTLADQAWETWYAANDHAAAVGVGDRDPAERRALQRLNTLVERLTHSTATDPDLTAVKREIQNCLNKITTVSVSWSEIADLPAIAKAGTLHQLNRASKDL